MVQSGIKAANNSEGQGVAQGASERKTILIVDDYEDTRVLVQEFLKAKGYRVVLGANGQEAISLAMSEHPDLIFMDLSMPVLDGFTATRLIREMEDLGRIPVVALTAYGSLANEFQENVDELGIGRIEVLSKPIDFDELEELLARVVPLTESA